MGRLRGDPIEIANFMNHGLLPTPAVARRWRSIGTSRTWSMPARIGPWLSAVAIRNRTVCPASEQDQFRLNCAATATQRPSRRAQTSV